MFTDIKKLKILVAIVEEGSFTGAADRLNIAQPWVSVQLKQLEDQLGLSLLERSKGKLIKLSANGKEIYSIAKKLLNACAEATSEIAELSKRDRGKLVLGIDPITLYMPERNELISRFMSQWRGITLQIVSRTPHELFDGLASGEFDLIMTSIQSPDPELEVLPLYEYTLDLLVPKSCAHKYESSEHGSVEGARILTLPDSYHPAIFSWLKESLSAHNVEWLECPEVSFQALIRYAVMMGVATLAPNFAESIPEMHNDMEIRRITETPLKVQWGLMRRAGSRKKAPESFWRMAAQSKMLLAA